MSAVSIAKCPDYEYTHVREAIEKSFESIGGFSKFIKPGMTVALKVNLVMAKKPEAAATTHPVVVEVLCDIITEKGGQALIIDGPGNLHLPEILKGIYKASGMLALDKKEGVRVNYDISSVNIENPDALYLKRLTLMKPLMEADLIINLPKLKTHCQMTYTGGIKNMFGAVPGLLKMEYHFRMPDYDKFADSIIDIFLAVKPALTLMDGIIGMDGDGPTSGHPVKIGIIALSENTFDLDLVCSAIMGIEPEKIPVLVQAKKRGLIASSLSEIEIRGEKLEDLIRKDLQIPSTKRGIHFLDHLGGRFLKKLLEPKISFSSACVKCGFCAKICPAKAITMHGNSQPPTVQHQNCIRCYCCHELCPSAAVNIKRFFLLNFLAPGRQK